MYEHMDITNIIIKDEKKNKLQILFQTIAAED